MSLFSWFVACGDAAVTDPYGPDEEPYDGAPVAAADDDEDELLSLYPDDAEVLPWYCALLVLDWYC